MTAISSSRARVVLAALTLSTCAFLVPSSHADDSDYPYTGRQHISIRGTVRRVDAGTDHLTLLGDDDRVYIIDAYGANIILPDITRSAETGDLDRGMHVRASGTLVGDNLVEAQTVRVVSDVAVRTAALDTPSDLPAGSTTLDGVVRLVDPDQSRITVADGDGNRDVVDTYDAAIILGNGHSDGQTGDLARGMRVRVFGTQLTHGRMVADRVRVEPDADTEIAPPAPEPAPVIVAPAPLPPVDVPLPVPAPRYGNGLVPPSPDPQYVLAHLDSYTGIIIDARHLPDISRSPSPAVYGPEPGESLLYPDRSHVPTPDEVQDESIVRYYHTEAEAEAGVAGDHPLILPAQAVLTPAKDSLQLSPDDMVLFNALEKDLHFTRTWKVGFLIPGNQ